MEGGTVWQKNHVLTRAVLVQPNQEKNFVRLVVERQKQAIPVPVPIRDVVEVSVSRSSSHTTTPTHHRRSEHVVVKR